MSLDSNEHLYKTSSPIHQASKRIPLLSSWIRTASQFGCSECPSTNSLPSRLTALVRQSDSLYLHKKISIRTALSLFDSKLGMMSRWWTITVTRRLKWWGKWCLLLWFRSALTAQRLRKTLGKTLKSSRFKILWNACIWRCFCGFFKLTTSIDAPDVWLKGFDSKPLIVQLGIQPFNSLRLVCTFYDHWICGHKTAAFLHIGCFQRQFIKLVSEVHLVNNSRHLQDSPAVKSLQSLREALELKISNWNQLVQGYTWSCRCHWSKLKTLVSDQFRPFPGFQIQLATVCREKLLRYFEGNKEIFFKRWILKWKRFFLVNPIEKFRNLDLFI